MWQTLRRQSIWHSPALSVCRLGSAYGLGPRSDTRRTGPHLPPEALSLPSSAFHGHPVGPPNIDP